MIKTNVKETNQTVSVIIAIIVLIVMAKIVIPKFKNMISDVRIRIIKRIQKNEGGKVNDKDDKGGSTAYGVSDLADGKKDNKYFGEDINTITPERAEEIFQKNYFSKLPQVESEEFQYHLYDFAVNAGVSQALKMYNDSIITDNPAKTARLYRIKFYETIAKKGNNEKFLKGWLNRVKY